MGVLRKVPLHQKLGCLSVEDGATKGATLGSTLFDADGSTITWDVILAKVAAAGGGNGGGSTVPDEVYWRTIREVPVNVQALANLTTTGIYVVTALGTSVTREVVPTIGRTTVSNGDGVLGDIGIDLAVVPDAGGGLLLRFARDAWGRVTGTSAATTDDLTEGATNLYFTAERAQDAVGSILADTATIDFTYDDGAGTIVANLTAAVVASLALADSALQPGDNISELTNDAGFIDDAPSDGKTYGRKDGAWVEVDSVPAGSWDPSMLPSTPNVWFDAEESEGLLTTAAHSLVLTAVASKYNAGTYSGTPNNCILQPRNPAFNGKRSIWMPGTSAGPSRLTLTGGLGLIQNKGACFLLIYGRFPVESTAVVGGASALIYVGSNATDVVRANISKSSTTGQTLRYGGRRLDADAFDGTDVGGNRGSTPFLAAAGFDYTGATKFLRIRGVQADADPTFQTAGSTSNTASEFAGVGASSAGGSNGPAMEWRVAIFLDWIPTTADIQRIEGWLAWRDGLAHLLLDPTHPYYNAPP